MQDSAFGIAKNVPDFCNNWAFFLDIDGTILQIAEHPDAVQVPSRVISTLSGIERAAAGALALVSGRGLEAIDRLLSPLQLSAAGQHGAEWRTPYGSYRVDQHYLDALAGVRTELEDKVARRPGLLLEFKGVSVALHYRGAPADRALAEAWLSTAMAQLPVPFHVHYGKNVMELRPAGSDKGAAVETFMQQPPFTGRRPLFIGDDVTDEDGFKAVNALGGDSIKVGNGDTAANWRLPNSDAVLDWLEHFLKDHADNS